MTGAPGDRSNTLRDYLRIARRRRWIILQPVLLVPLAAVLFSLHQTRLYRADAQVLLSSQNLAAQLTGTQATGINLQPDRIAETQADVARVPVVAQRVLDAVRGTGLTVDELLNDSSVSTAPDADLLTFRVANHDPLIARRLASAYAREYTVYRHQLDTASIENALGRVDARIAELVRDGGRRTALYSSLVDRAETLATMEALQTSNATVVKPADRAVQVQPKPTRNGILGLALGIVLGVGLAFLWESLDTRVRSAHEIGEKLGGPPLLARIGAPPKKLSAARRLVMLDDPRGMHAEAFRMLRTNLDFVTIDRGARSIMITSAVEQEGKSTTAANLAVALARGGRRVALVDLDLRRPYLATFFDLRGPGITQVALRHASLAEALARVAISDPSRVGANGDSGHATANGNGSHGDVRGLLEVLPAGPIPPDPGEFVASHALAEVMTELRERVDVVLIDTPPVLRVGDAMTLSTVVDAIVVVTRMRVVRRHMLTELSRQLAAVPTPTLGYVVTEAAGEDDGEGYGYGYYSNPYARGEPERTDAAGVR